MITFDRFGGSNADHTSGSDSSPLVVAVDNGCQAIHPCRQSLERLCDPSSDVVLAGLADRPNGPSSHRV